MTPYTLLSFAASSGVGFYEAPDGLRRLDIVTGKDELLPPGVDQSSGGLDFDLILAGMTFDSRDQLVSFIHAEYLRDKKNIYYTILFTDARLDDGGRLAITKFLDEPELTKIEISRALVPTLEEIADRRLVQFVKQLANKSGFANVSECLATELRDVSREPTTTLSKSPDVAGYYLKFVESLKGRMSSPLQNKFAGHQQSPVVAQEQQTIGKTVIIKGEIVGSESLYIDGRVEGSISIAGRVTIGRNGIVAANISAHEIVILGKVRGNLAANDRVDIRSDGSLTGDVVASRISIEDGAFFKGGIDIRKSTPHFYGGEAPAPNKTAEPSMAARKHS